MINSLDISTDIYNALSSLGVSDNIYDESVPNKLPENCKDFILYEVGSTRPAYDYDSGDTTRSYALIMCYAKDKANGLKNTAKLRTMVKSLTDAFAIDGYRTSLSSIEIPTQGIQNYHGQSIIYNILK